MPADVLGGGILSVVIGVQLLQAYLCSSILDLRTQKCHNEMAETSRKALLQLVKRW